MDFPTEAAAPITLDPAEVCALWDSLFLAETDDDGALAESNQEIDR